MLASLLSSLAGKIAAVGVAVAAATGGVAATQSLSTPEPDPVTESRVTVQDEGEDAPEVEEEEAPEEEDGDDADGSDQGNPDAPGRKVAEAVHTVLADESLEGREKGQAVAAAARRANGSADKGRPEGRGGNRPDHAGSDDDPDEDESEEDEAEEDEAEEDEDGSEEDESDNSGGGSDE